MKSRFFVSTTMIAILGIPLILILATNYLDENNIHETEQNTQREFVVGFYMAGESFDSNLINEDISDTIGLESEKFQFYYLVDYDGMGNTEFFVANNYTRNHINLSKILPYDSDELNMGSSDVFSAYVNYIYSIKAKYHCLVIWGHGMGYDGICFDGNMKLTSTDIHDALIDKDFDLVIFDACEMASIGFLHEIDDVTNYVIGTEKDLPDRGLDYAGSFSSFIMGGKYDPLTLSRCILDETKSYYQRNPSKYSLQISLIDMKEVENLCEKMLDYESYDFSSLPPSYESGIRFDLGLYFEMNKMNDLKERLDKSIIYQVTLPSGSGIPIEGISGISMIKPNSSDNIPLINNVII